MTVTGATVVNACYSPHMAGSGFLILVLTAGRSICWGQRDGRRSGHVLPHQGVTVSVMSVPQGHTSPAAAIMEAAQGLYDRSLPAGHGGTARALGTLCYSA